MKKKGFTLVELLVVIAIIALLMGILMPALAKVKAIAYRMVCGANLSGIGKSMLVYANDYEGDLPRLGGPRGIWVTTGTLGNANWQAKGANTSVGGTPPVFGTVGNNAAQPGPNGATITASLYYLVRAYDVAPGQFVCRGDNGTKAMKISDFLGLSGVALALTDVWDFGTGQQAGKYPGTYCSYSYHMPYSFTDTSTSTVVSYNLNNSGDASSPVCADRNPYQDKNSKGIIPPADTTKTPCPSWDATANAYKDEYKLGNSVSHQQDGQNVLYLDTHVAFQRFANCGIGNDNIYKCWEGYNSTTGAEPAEQLRQVGNGTATSCLDGSMANTVVGTGPKAHPYSIRDALLVNEVLDATGKVVLP